MTDDIWEKLRHMTIDELITNTKLGGSAQSLVGTTTPEGYPFRVLVVVGSNEGNMAAVNIVKQAERLIGAMAAWFVRVDKAPE